MAAILPQRETLEVEFKSDRAKLSDSDLVDAVVAFANTAGGTIYLGVEDDGTVTGLHQAPPGLYPAGRLSGQQNRAPRVRAGGTVGGREGSAGHSRP